MKPTPEPAPELFDPAGLEALLARAEHDPAASREFDFLADVVAAAELERARLTLRRAPSAPRIGLPRRAWLLAAAAAVLFLTALALWSTRGSREEVHRALAELGAPRYLVSELRGTDEAQGAAFARAMEPYARGDWSAAERALAELLQRYPEHGPGHFYLAAACEQLGQGARAQAEYERAATGPDPLLSQHARLRLALLLLARGERERARTALSTLRDEGGELAPNAREWLERLER